MTTTMEAEKRDPGNEVAASVGESNKSLVLLSELIKFELPP